MAYIKKKDRTEQERADDLYIQELNKKYNDKINKKKPKQKEIDLDNIEPMTVVLQISDEKYCYPRQSDSYYIDER